VPFALLLELGSPIKEIAPGDGRRIGGIWARVPAVKAVDKMGAAPKAGLDRVECGNFGAACPVDAGRDDFDLAQSKHIII